VTKHVLNCDLLEPVYKFSLYFTKNIVVTPNIRPDIQLNIRYPALLDIWQDIQYPALGIAGYPAKIVSGASLIFFHVFQQRHRTDRQVNNRKSQVLRKGFLVEEKWHRVQVQDFSGTVLYYRVFKRVPVPELIWYR
jgi:hypothetical protein